MITTLLFDLDNTLFDYDMAFEEFINRLGRRFQNDLSSEMALIHQMNAKGHAPRVAFFDWLVEQYSIQESGEALWKIMQEDFSNFILVTNHTKSLLKNLSKNYTVAILTNGSSLNQRNKIQRSGLGKIVPIIFISGEMGCKKPDSEIFRMTCEKLDTSPTQTLYIGDHWENDIVGAKGAGLKTCWLSHGSPLLDTKLGLNDFVIASLDELPSILALYD